MLHVFVCVCVCVVCVHAFVYVCVIVCVHVYMSDMYSISNNDCKVPGSNKSIRVVHSYAKYIGLASPYKATAVMSTLSIYVCMQVCAWVYM